MQARIELGIAAPITPYVPDPLIQAVAQAANYNAGKYTHPSCATFFIFSILYYLIRHM